MKRTTCWMIVGMYYISQAMGILSFSYDFDEGKVKTKLFITIHCAAMSLLAFGSVPLILHMEWNSKPTIAPDLHYKINILICLIRIIATLITIALGWIKRNDFMKTINDFQNFRWQFLQKFQSSEKVEKYFENSIRSKFIWGLCANIILFIGTYDILLRVFNIKSRITVAGMGLLVMVSNVVTAHYYFALTNVNFLLAVIKEEVVKILNSCWVLCKRQHLKQIKPGAFITQCCQLADDLDNLAMAQYNLRQLADRITNMYDIQGACLALFIYLNNIGALYMGYMLFQHETLFQAYGKWAITAVACGLFFYYLDLTIFMMSILKMEDLIENTGQLLKHCQPWMPKLDERLETSFNKFSTQIALFPINMKLVGLFQFGRPMVFAIFGSTISHAIVLIQYDYKNDEDM